MLPNYYCMEKKLSMKRELALFKDINALYINLDVSDQDSVIDFRLFKEVFERMSMNTIHFSLGRFALGQSKAECPIEFSELASRIVINTFISKNTAAMISFGVYFLYFFYSLSPLKKRIKIPVTPEVFEVMMDPICVADDVYAYVLNKMIKEGMMSFGVKTTVLDKPLELNKRELLKKVYEDLNYAFKIVSRNCNNITEKPETKDENFLNIDQEIHQLVEEEQKAFDEYQDMLKDLENTIKKCDLNI